MAASLPALRPLFAKFYDRTLKYTYGAASKIGYARSDGYGAAYGKGTNNKYERQKNTVDRDQTNLSISLRSFQEREAFSGKRDGTHVHTTGVTRDGRPDRKSSQGDEASGAFSNDYDSDEIILNQKHLDDNAGNKVGHDIVEDVTRSQRILKTTTVYISRR